jgi:predicted DNA-binding protein (UPF0251 family)
MKRDAIDCAVCGEPFTPLRSTHTVCSDECRTEQKRIADDGARRLVNVPAMSFQDIAIRLRVSKPTVQKDYQSALAKLLGVVDEEDFR